MTTTRQTETQTIAIVEVRLERREGESCQDVHERLSRETIGLYSPADGDWEGDTLVWRYEFDLAAFAEWHIKQSVGEYFQNDSVVCPTCKRVNEHK